MDEQNKGTGEPTPKASVQPAPAPPDVAARRNADAEQVALMAEAAGVSDAGKIKNLQAQVRSGLRELAEVREELRAEYAKAHLAPESAGAARVVADPMRASVTGDRRDKLVTMMASALAIKAGAQVNDIDNDVRRHADMPSLSILKACMIADGSLTERAALEIGNSELADMFAAASRDSRNVCHGHRTHRASSSLFPLLLTTSVNARLRAGYEGPALTWSQYARPEPISDFNVQELPRFSDAPRLEPTKEGGAIKYLRFDEERETYRLSSYSAGMVLSFEMIRNDRLGAFLRQAEDMGRWVAFQIDEDVAFTLMANGNLSDAAAFFNTTAGNLVHGTAYALATAGLNKAYEQFLTRVGPKGADKTKGLARLVAAFPPSRLLVPPALRSTALQLTRSQADPSSANAGVANIYTDLVPVTVPYFQQTGATGASSTAYYLVAGAEAGWYNVGFLDGIQTPRVEQETDFDTNGVKFAFRHYWVAKPLDRLGAVKLTGVAE